MERRKVLKLFGALFVCFAGHSVLADTKKQGAIKWNPLPQDYYFTEKGMGDIIIERKNGNKIIVPFSDICDALEK